MARWIRLSRVLFSIILLLACQGGESKKENAETSVDTIVSRAISADKQALIERALQTGVLNEALTTNDLIQALFSRYQQAQTLQQDIIATMFAEQTLTEPNLSFKYDPTHRSQLIAITSSRTVPLFYVKNAPNLQAGPVFSVYGSWGQGSYAYFATGILQKIWLQKTGRGSFPAMDDIDYQSFDNPMAQLIATLLPATNVTSPDTAANIVFAFEDSSGYARAWFKDKFPQAIIKRCRFRVEYSTLAEFKACIESSDLLFIGNMPDNNLELTMSYDDVALAIKSRLVAGGNIYMEHHHYEDKTDFMMTLAPIFGIAFPYQQGNYWQRLTMEATSLEEMKAYQAEINLLEHLWNQNFSSVDLSVCDNNHCQDSPQLTEELLRISQWWQESLTAIDTEMEQSLFISDETAVEKSADTGMDIIKLQILLGDSLRQTIQYPVNPHNDFQAFAAAYLADNLNFYHREHAPMQPDLGDFVYQHDASSKLDSLELVAQLSDKTVNANYISQLDKQNSLTRLTGYYLLPGSRIRLTRRDSHHSDEVYAVINSQSRGNTHEYKVSSQGVSDYQRPLYLQSPAFLLPKAEPVVLSTPYGGTLLIEQPVGEGEISIDIEGVYSYPFLADFNDLEQVDRFTAELASSPIKWLGIKSDVVELNAPKDLIEPTLNDAPYFGDVVLYMEDIRQYLFKGAYELAGYVDSDVSVGLNQTKGVTNTCLQLGWDCSDSDIHRTPKVQRINVDYNPRCGAACSGNPFDVTSLNPLGRLESHELGHELQIERMHIVDSNGSKTTGETTNLLFERYKAWQYYQGKANAEQIPINEIRGRNTFLMLQCAQRGSNVFNTMQAVLWQPSGTYTNAAERLNFYGQLVMKADREQASLGFTGWDIITLLYKHDRLLRDASRHANSTERLAKLDALGFNLYSASEATLIDGNDYLLIVTSILFKQDMTTYFETWGIALSDKAKQQVNEFKYPNAALEYYYFDSDLWTDMGIRNSKALAIDGTTPWPLNTGHARNGFSCDANGNYSNNLY